MHLTFLLVLIAFAIDAWPSAGGANWEARSVPSEAQTGSASPIYFRCFIRVPDNMTSRAPVDLWTDSTMFSFADFPGRFTILLNGQKIAEGDSLPPEPRRRFKIPKGIFEKKSFNVLAVRLEGQASAGLRTAPVLHGYHDELVLAGTWESYSGDVDPSDLRPQSNQPPRAFFTEAQFRESSTLLAANAELVRGQRLSPAESLARMHTPPELAVDSLLSEPLVAQPTHFSFDARGRLWVAQYRQYPYPAGLKMISRDKYYRAVFDRIPPAPPHHDRGRDIISLHEDTDGDGKFDRHREVLTGLNMANAVLHGHGGIWVMHTPYLLFYPDANGDDIPDGDPEIRLAGFGLEDTHSVANGLAWGPDGWIYGAQGSTTTSHIRRPDLDAPNAPGVYYESCMVWRYHPDTRAYEIFAEGGGNNFGLEFDSEGRVYSGHNGGETRGWHFVQSGIYLKQGKDPGKFGPPTNPYSFGELPMMPSSNKITRFSHHFAIAEGTALPPEYRGRLFNVDPLHHNVVVSAPEHIGSTFKTSDVGIALESDDNAFRPVFAANAPDGSMYVADFYEEYIAHGQNYQGQIDPDSGRIYRLRGKTSTLEKNVDLERKSSSELVTTLSHPNKWHRYTAVRLIGERRDPASKRPLRERLRSRETHPALEALWALHQCRWLDDEVASTALEHSVPAVRAWVIRLLGDRKQLPEPFRARLVHLCETESNAEVRCQIASTARRLSAHDALPLVQALVRRDVDTSDPFIPLLCWWTLEGFCDSDPAGVLRLFLNESNSKTVLWQSSLANTHLLPRLMRRFAMKGTRADLIVCSQLLNAADTDSERKALLSGFEEAFKGRALPALPDELAAALAQSGHDSLLLRIRRREPDAIEKAIHLLGDSKSPRQDRIVYARTFGEVREPRALPVLLEIAKSGGDLELRKASFSALVNFPDESIGTEIVGLYMKLPAELQVSAESLLVSRPKWSVAFLALLERGTINSRTISGDTIEKLRNHSDQGVRQSVAKLFPRQEPSAQPGLRAELERVQTVLKTASGNPYSGEPIFAERCASCHQLFHKGGQVGPNLTSYQRDDLNTMLPSILSPSAEIREGYINHLVETKDGRSLSGFLVDQDANVIVLRGIDGQDVTIPRTEITEDRASSMSLMPEGLLSDLTDQQLRDFFAYLRIPQPISR